jgi:putative peptidoglycan lipid II flippase
MSATPPAASRFHLRWLAIPRGVILRGVLTASSCAILVKAMGFGKDLVVASRYGTADALDAFGMAYLLPALTATIFSGIHDALVPAHTDQQENVGAAAADRLAANGFSLYGLLLALVLAALGLCSQWIIPQLANGFPEEKQALTRELFLQLLPFAWCLGVSYYLGAWLNSHKRFLMAAIAPAAIPVCSALALLFFNGDGIHILLHATQVGGALLVATLAWPLWKKTGVGLVAWDWKNPETKRLFKEWVPLLAGPLITAGLPLVDMYMAGHHDSGDVSVLGYSEKICSIFFAVLATSVGAALFPYLAELAAQGKWKCLLARLHQYTAIIVAASIPIVVGLWFLSPWIVSLLFERGAFAHGDVERVAVVLRCHALQIPCYVAAVLASHVVLAMRSGKFMLLTTLVNLTLNVILNNLFIGPFGLAGIPLATAFVYLLSALMLYAHIRRFARRRSA